MDDGPSGREGVRMAEVQWYYARNDQQFGPVSAVELKQLANAGRLSPDDLLWREGMESWETAINLRGLFATDPAPVAVATTVAPILQSTQSATLATASVVRSQPAATDASSSARKGVSLRTILRSTQIILWGSCVLIVVFGVVLFTRAFLTANDPSQEAAAAAVFATFFIAAYVLARSGEKLAELLNRGRRRDR